MFVVVARRTSRFNEQDSKCLSSSGCLFSRDFKQYKYFTDQYGDAVYAARIPIVLSFPTPFWCILLVSKLYWWVAYDVIKNMILKIIINLPKISIWPIGPYNVSLYQILTYLDQ